MSLSTFDIFKIGIGPSSSHTVGPMRAAHAFGASLQAAELLETTTNVRIELFGSLALTGRGHGTDRAILLGLMGEDPESVRVELIDERLAQVRQSRKLKLLSRHEIEFNEASHLLFLTSKLLPRHSNGMRFTAVAGDRTLAQKIFYSVGGGFITDEQGNPVLAAGATVRACPKEMPHPFKTAADLLSQCERHGKRIWEIVLENERAIRSDSEINAGLLKLRSTMQACIERGIQQEGILPGGLNVKRRAAALVRKLQQKKGDPLAVMDWVNVYAIAVNEENAAGGRVVTAPTNGAAGVIPSVLQYYSKHIPDASEAGTTKFLLTAAAIGMLYKLNASISGAEVGCQGEVGVACSMAAAGLVAAQDGSNAQVEHAAEIGMEHHLGMTCDPVGGLVQIPCIERNAVGAVKAINAARMALDGDGTHRVSLDQVIRTMYQTGLDMQSRYKETSQAGLAVNVVEC